MGHGCVIFERAKIEVINSCLNILEQLRREPRDGQLPDKLTIRIQGMWHYSGEIRESWASIVIPKPISYVTHGQLIGNIEGHQVAVFNDGERHFRVVINGSEHQWLSQEFVEQELKISVQKKQTGGQVGYPSEAVIRAVWRHLADRYNEGDMTVQYKADDQRLSSSHG